AVAGHQRRAAVERRDPGLRLEAGEGRPAQRDMVRTGEHDRDRNDRNRAGHRDQPADLVAEGTEARQRQLHGAGSRMRASFSTLALRPRPHALIARGFASNAMCGPAPTRPSMPPASTKPGTSLTVSTGAPSSAASSWPAP